jgi:NADH dehydrogenase (ubiquinone) 1 beta subcomplex subunit 3
MNNLTHARRRNEVWRYNVKHFGTHRSRLLTLLFRGFPLGLAAFGATIAAEYAFGIDFHGSHHAQYTIGGQVFGGHDHGHHDEGHH